MKVKNFLFILTVCFIAGTLRTGAMAIVGGVTETGYGAVGAFISDGALWTGTLINEKWVLTVAHPFDYTTPDSFLFGSSALDPDEIYSVASIHVHSGFNSTLLTNDIALVRLSFPVQGITPITYNSAGTVPEENDSVRFVGYGVTDASNDDSSGIKHSAALNVTDIYTDQFLTETSASVGPCLSDSGGPAIISITDVYYVAGVFSYITTSDCLNADAYSMRVSYYNGYIENILATVDSTAPGFVSASPANITDTGFDLAVQLDEPGSVYYSLLADGSAEPAAADLIAGTGGIKNGTISVTSASTAFSASVTGLTPVTGYDLYIIAGDDEDGPNFQGSVTKLDVTTVEAGSDDDTPGETNNPPAKPVLSSPLDGAADIALPVAFTWNSSSDPDSDSVAYELVISEDAAFTNAVTYDVNERSADVISFAGMSLFLLASFFMIRRNGRKVKTYMLIPVICLFFISGGIFCNNSGDDDTDNPGTEALTYTLDGLSGGTTYYWKVIARDEHNAVTESDVWSFTTAQANKGSK